MHLKSTFRRRRLSQTPGPSRAIARITQSMRQVRALRNCRCCEETRIPPRPGSENVKRNESSCDVLSGKERGGTSSRLFSAFHFIRLHKRSHILPAGLTPLMRVARRLDSRTSFPLVPLLSESSFVTRSITASILFGYSMQEKASNHYFCEIGTCLSLRVTIAPFCLCQVTLCRSEVPIYSVLM